MNIICADTETFRYNWLFCGRNLTNGEEYIIHDDREALLDFYNTHKDDVFLFYNGRGYDQYIVKGILVGMDPYEINDWIINRKQPGWAFSNAFSRIQLNFFDVMGSNMKGLKTLEGFMGLSIEETQVDFNIDRPLTDEEMALTIHYCMSDVKATCMVFAKTYERFQAQIAVMTTFNRPLRDLCKTEAQLVSKVLDASPKTFDDEFDIRMPETLEINRYTEVVDWFMNAHENARREAGDLDEEEFTKYFYSRNLELDIAGVLTVFAWGGVHGALKQYNHTCAEDETLVMVDVDQLYPSLMVKYNLLSRAVKKPEKFQWILDTSLRLKAEGKKAERLPYKLICNITYGATGDKHNAMRDPLHRNLVCVFGQVLLLDLIEKVEHCCELLQANTDGLLVKIKKTDLDMFKGIVQEWEQRTHLKMSYDYFERIVQGDVNNYILVDYKGKTKTKGAYVKELNTLDYDLPIINQAIMAYVLHGTHPRETITSCDDLREFQKIVKVSSKYSYAVKIDSHLESHPYGKCKYFSPDEYDGYCTKLRKRGRNVTCKNCPHHEVELVVVEDKVTPLTDKTFRVFASLRPTDGTIKKVKREGANPEKFANTPDRCFIYNKEVNGVKVPTYLDREWYVGMAIQRLKEKFGLVIEA